MKYVRIELNPTEAKIRIGLDGRRERYYTTHCETCGIEQRNLRVFTFPLRFYDFYEYCFYDGNKGIKHICKVCECKYEHIQR